MLGALYPIAATNYPIAFDGSATTFFEAESWGDGAQVAGDAITLRGNNRLYLKDVGGYAHIDLRGKTLRFTADVSRVPCSCNAALYLVSMRFPNGGYCDIQTQPSCTEIDLFEANSHSIQATVHTRRGYGGDSTCNQWGCAVNWGNFATTANGQSTSALYGPHGHIDSSRPFEVATSLSLEGELVVELEQNGRRTGLFNRSAASNPVGGSCGGACGVRDPPNEGAPTGLPAEALAVSAAASVAGMVLVISLWGNDDVSRWLDYECPASRRAGVGGARLHLEPSRVTQYGVSRVLDLGATRPRKKSARCPTDHLRQTANNVGCPTEELTTRACSSRAQEHTLPSRPSASRPRRAHRPRRPRRPALALNRHRARSHTHRPARAHARPKTRRRTHHPAHRRCRHRLCSPARRHVHRRRRRRRPRHRPRRHLLRCPSPPSRRHQPASASSASPALRLLLRCSSSLLHSVLTCSPAACVTVALRPRQGCTGRGGPVRGADACWTVTRQRARLRPSRSTRQGRPTRPTTC